MQILHTLLLPLLIPLSWLYGLIIWIRNGLFNFGLFISVSFEIPIISVGNVTTGGTGKTPMVIYFAKLIESSGYKPGIVSRGYRRNSRGLVMVHDGNRFLTDVDSAGDEPYLMGKELNTVPIIVCKNRMAGIHELQNNNSVDIVILDDAFQNRKIERNVDVIMISAYDKISDYHLLPWGKLREPLNNLKRANCVIFTKTNHCLNSDIYNILNPYQKKSFISGTMMPVLMKMDEKGYHKSSPVNEPIFAFCGIGNPNSFIQSINEVGLTIAGKRIFRDHQIYNPRILQKLSEQVQKRNCRAVVTTEKDMVKIPERFIQEFIFYVIKIDFVFENDSNMIDLIKPVFPPSSPQHC